MRPLLALLLALPSIACGGATEHHQSSPAFASNGGASGGASSEPSSDGGSSGVGFADTAAANSANIATMITTCDTPDASRPATATENAQTCICTKESPMLPPYWVCYGPGPSQTRAQAKCNSLVYAPSAPDAGAESCLTLWEDCSSGGPYGISCVDGFCQCLLSGKPSAILPPGTECPQSKADLNAQCGWELQ